MGNKPNRKGFKTFSIRFVSHDTLEGIYPFPRRFLFLIPYLEGFYTLSRGFCNTGKFFDHPVSKTFIQGIYTG